ncbi:MAG: CoA transferase [Rhodospirillaceae bacterium]|nr:CoA transferase [Rhodospirillaceae bacterium]
MRRRTVLSLEQATALPYATQRFVQLGWRVIRIENTPGEGERQPGDPNRYVGKRILDESRFSLFVAPNVEKEAIALNLKRPEGRALLLRLIETLEADVFCCNTMPARYKGLGIDYETLSAARPGLVWAGISAMGPDYPDVAGYDPVMQAMSGLMELNGFPEGPPTLMGVPLTDLKAGDEVYANVMLALLERAETGRGKRIDVSMLQAGVSWLVAVLPLLDMDAEPGEVSRTGNAHRRFVPTNVYPTRDGFIYIALGSNVQWQRLTALPRFAPLAARTDWTTAEGRYRDRQEMYRAIGTITAEGSFAEVAADFAAAKVPHTKINDVATTADLAAIRAKLNATELPNGRKVRLPPAAVDVADLPRAFAPPPRYAEHTRPVLAEIGLKEADIDALIAAGIVA